MLHSLLGWLPEGGEALTLRDAETERCVQCELRFLPRAKIYYLAVSAATNAD